MRAVFLDFGTVSSGDLDTGTLERALPGIALHDSTPQAEVPARIAGHQVVLANKSVIEDHFREPAAELIALTATGVDNVDVPAARAAGVAVCNLRDYCTDSVAQHAFALLLALTHRLADYHALVAGGRWQAARQFSVFTPFASCAAAGIAATALGAPSPASRAFGEGRNRNRPGVRQKAVVTWTRCSRTSTCCRCTARYPGDARPAPAASACA
jgi:hypothetical protein